MKTKHEVKLKLFEFYAILYREMQTLGVLCRGWQYYMPKQNNANITEFAVLSTQLVANIRYDLRKVWFVAKSQFLTQINRFERNQILPRGYSFDNLYHRLHLIHIYSSHSFKFNIHP